MKTQNLKILFELVFRQCVFIILNIYAIRKIFGGQFYMNGELPADVSNLTLGEVDSFSLAWTFMGHSYYYVLFIGIAQLVGAWLLLWNKTKIIGALILFPIMINIIIFNLVFLNVYSALTIAFILLSMLAGILFFNREQIIEVFHALINFQLKPDVLVRERILTIAISTVLLILIFTICSLIERFTWIT